jgi:hypothetical protein
MTGVEKKRVFDLFEQEHIQHDLKRIYEENLYDDDIFIGKLVSDVKTYIKILEQYDFKYYGLDRNRKLGPTETTGFFRHYERMQYHIWILQYMISFVAKIPLEKDIEAELVDPSKQFKAFITYCVGLLKKKDVVNAIMRELRDQGIMKNENAVQCKLWVYKKSKEISDLAASDSRSLVDNWKQMFLALRKLSHFWILICKEDTARIRRGDVFMYMLSFVLLNRIYYMARQRRS